MNHYKKLYNTNMDYQQYVIRCATANHESVEETLKHKTIQNVGDYYAEKEHDKVSKTVMTAGCGGAK